MNQSEAIVQFIGLRCAGYRPFQGAPGEVYGGRYYPALVNGSDVQRNARWVGQFYINKRGGARDETGAQVNPNDVVQITFWNGRSATPGKGLADLAAKSITVGKEITLRCNLRFYDSRVFDGDQPVMRRDGQPGPAGNGQLTKRAISFVARANSLIWGDDSAKLINAEIQAWRGIIDFTSRPPQWNVEQTPDHAAWQQIKAFRNGLTYTQGPVFGYALVVSNNTSLGASAGAGVQPNLTQQVQQAIPQQQAYIPPAQTVNVQPQNAYVAPVVANNAMAAMAGQTGGQVRI